VTKPGEDDPFESMLEDDALEELDEFEEVPGNSLLHGELDDDDEPGSSGARPKR
jgi:hypothetical protein